LRFEDQNLGTAVGEEESELGLSLARADRNDDRADPVAGEHRGKKFPAVAKKQCDAVPRLHTEFGQARANLSDQPVELAIADAAILDDGRPLRKSAHE